MATREDGKTPNLSQQEQQDVDENQPPRAAVLHEIIRTQGDQELERNVAALWWSALAAGLTMGLSLMAMGLLTRACRTVRASRSSPALVIARAFWR